jgi:hypothetical protein
LTGHMRRPHSFWAGAPLVSQSPMDT